MAHPSASRPSASTILLAIAIVLLGLVLLDGRSQTAAAQDGSTRTAIGIAAVPHPGGQAPNVYRLWSDGTVEVSTGTDRRRNPWKVISD